MYHGSFSPTIPTSQVQPTPVYGYCAKNSPVSQRIVLAKILQKIVDCVEIIASFHTLSSKTNVRHVTVALASHNQMGRESQSSSHPV